MTNNKKYQTKCLVCKKMFGTDNCYLDYCSKVCEKRQLKIWEKEEIARLSEKIKNRRQLETRRN